MRLYKDGAFVDDPWRSLDEGEAPGADPAILSLAQWLALGAEARRGGNAPLGVRLDAGEMVDALLPDLDRIALVALSFPKFADGRAFSKASLLRRHGFKGEIRAVGDVLWDQLQLMRRCGFDAFLIENEPTIHALEGGKSPFLTDVYQPGRGGGEQPADPRRPWAWRAAARG